MPLGHCAESVYSLHIQEMRRGEMGQRMVRLDVWLVCATILRICPSLDNASPSAGHTIFKQSVVSDQTHSISGHLMEIKELLAKLCWTSSAQ